MSQNGGVTLMTRYLRLMRMRVEHSHRLFHYHQERQPLLGWQKPLKIHPPCTSQLAESSTALSGFQDPSVDFEGYTPMSVLEVLFQVLLQSAKDG